MKVMWIFKVNAQKPEQAKEVYIKVNQVCTSVLSRTNVHKLYIVL